MCSKSGVAPIKTTILPRLKLCAASMLTKLYSADVQLLQMQFSKVCFWSDSTIVLNWINTQPHTLKTFVSNRVSEIQQKTEMHEWRHVPTHDNPADLISRGQNPEEFLTRHFWSHGPNWLSQNNDTWPKGKIKSCIIPEIRVSEPILSLKITQEGINLLSKYSNFRKLQFVVAYCFRFFNNLKNRHKTLRQTGRLSKTELNFATDTILRITQAEAFLKEFLALYRKEAVDPKSSLYRLNPFLDQGVIKLGGRLSNTNMAETKNTQSSFQNITMSRN